MDAERSRLPSHNTSRVPMLPFDILLGNWGLLDDRQLFGQPRCARLPRQHSPRIRTQGSILVENAIRYRVVLVSWDCFVLPDHFGSHTWV